MMFLTLTPSSETALWVYPQASPPTMVCLGSWPGTWISALSYWLCLGSFHLHLGFLSFWVGYFQWGLDPWKNKSSQMMSQMTSLCLTVWNLKWSLSRPLEFIHHLLECILKQTFEYLKVFSEFIYILHICLYIKLLDSKINQPVPFWAVNWHAYKQNLVPVFS